MGRSQLLVVDNEHPNPRRIRQATDVLVRGGVIAYPTDTVYGIGCSLEDRKAIDRVYRIKGIPRGQRLSFICESLAAAAEYAHITDFAYRWLRRLLPGPYTILLHATRAVPKVLREKRQEVGIRVPDSPICHELVKALGHPIITTSATDPDSEEALIDADVVKDQLGHQLDLVLDGGLLTREMSTVISLMNDEIEIVREGKGPVDLLVGEG